MYLIEQFSPVVLIFISYRIASIKVFLTIIMALKNDILVKIRLNIEIIIFKKICILRIVK